MMSRYLKTCPPLWLAAALGLSPGLVLAQESVVFPPDGSPPGEFIFTVPANVSQISVQVWGAGAGGRAQAGQSAGGGAGGYAGLTNLAVSPNDEYRVIVGSGGAAGAVGEPSAFGGVDQVPAGCIGTDAAACAAGGRVTVPPGSYGGCSTDTGALPPDECVGNVVFAGGNGAAPGSNVGGGGGGSGSADGAGGAGGVGASGSAGGAGGARTGNGGNGGNGGANTMSGSPGTIPGGGGGGRGAGAAGLGLTSGAGADGRVIVTYDFDPPPPPPSATAIPTASTWGLLILGGLLGALGGRKLRRRD